MPEFEALVRNGTIQMHFGAHVKEITEHTLTFTVDGEAFTIKNDFVFAMTGYHPDHSFLTKMGVQIDEETGRQFIQRIEWKRMLKIFSLQVSLPLEIMQMKYLSRTVDFMEMRLRKPLH